MLLLVIEFVEARSGGFLNKIRPNGSGSSRSNIVLLLSNASCNIRGIGIDTITTSGNSGVGVGSGVKRCE
jgi:hypothetical protein